MQSQPFDIFFKRLFILIGITIGLLLLYKLIPVIVPFLSAFILAYLFNPLVKRLSRYVRRWVAILFVYFVITTTLSLLLWWLIPTLWVQLQSAWDYFPRAVQWYNEDARVWINRNGRISLPPIQPFGLSHTLVDYLNEHYNAEDAQSLMRQLMDSGLTFINNAGLVVLVPILTFYFLFNWDARILKWKIAIPVAYARTVAEIVHDCDQALMAFVKGQLLVMILLGIVYAVQLQLIGLDLGIIIGMVAGIASFVPYLGFVIGFAASIVAGLFQFGVDWMRLSLIVGAFLVGQAVEGYILQPLLLGDKIGLSPLWVIFSVLAGASLMGFVGMLIALPVSAILNVLFIRAYRAYLQTEFYKGRRQYKLFD